MNKKHHLFLALSLCIGLVALAPVHSVFALSGDAKSQSLIDPAPIIVAGGYYSGSGFYPLLNSSQDGADTWTNSINSANPVLPANFNYGAFLHSSCSGLQCVAAGYYRENDTNYPLLANSKDKGKTWTYAIDNTKPLVPDDFKEGSFFGVSCSGLQCVAVGSYSFNYPLLANSKDGGATWTYAINSTTPELPCGYKAGMFNAASCSKSNCVAVGYYLFPGQSTYPLIANSKDGGSTWKYEVDATHTTLPDDFSVGAFGDASCSGLNCVAVGSYSNQNISYPLLANSKDAGTTWTYSISHYTSGLPSNITSGTFSSVSCSKLHCVAAGSYNRFPLIANSLDGGATWTFPVTSTSPTLPSDYIGGGFLKTSCSNLACAAVGYYYGKNSSNSPLLANSKDGGVTWTYSITNTTPTLPSSFENIHLADVHCSGLTCISTGSYDFNAIVNPLLAKSKDGGTTWTYLFDNDIPLPPDFLRGSFDNIGEFSTYLPDSRTG